MPDEIDNMLDYVESKRRLRTQSQIIDAADADKKKAAGAIELGKSMGQDPGVVYNDYDEFLKEHKIGLSNQIVSQDSLIDNYINSHPLAAKVSKDDWGALGDFTDKLTKYMPVIGPGAKLFRSQGFWDVVGKGIEGMGEPYKERAGIPAEEIEKIRQYVPGALSDEGWEYLKETGELPGIPRLVDPLFFAYKLPQEITRVFEALSYGVAAAGRELEFKRTGDEAWANRLARDLKIGADLVQMGVAHEPRLFTPAAEDVALAKAAHRGRTLEALQNLNALRDLAAKSETFIRAGEQPPVGMDSAIDRMVADGAKEENAEFKDLEKAADKTETKQLSPELFQRLVEQAGTRDIEVRWDAVRALYGDKVPEPGDGILGDVPNIQKQWAASSQTGESISMPASFWLSRIDPDTAKALEKDRSLRPNSMTLNEAEALQERPMAQRSLVGNLRAAGGLEPMLKDELGRAEDVIREGGWIQFGEHTALLIAPTKEWTANERAIAGRVDELMNRIAPEGVHVIPGQAIVESAGEGIEPIQGKYIQKGQSVPVILWSLDAEDPMGTARHEAVHFLKGKGFITPEEWRILSETAEKEGWLDKHGIGRRYGDYPKELQIEEAVAEEYSRWAKDKAAPSNKVFEKIKQLLNGIRQAIREILGKEPTAQDLFSRIEEGDVGRRRPGKAAKDRAMAQRGEEEPPLFERGAILPKVQHDRFMRLLRAIQAGDEAKQLKEQQKIARQHLTPEWNENWKKMSEEVKEDFKNQPSIRVNDLLANGMYNEEKIGKLKLNLTDAWPYQKEGVPKQYVDNVGGVNPDQLAKLFGYQTGNDMLDDIVQFKKRRGDLGPKAFVEKLIKEETDRRMELRYGKKAEIELAEAREHVVMSTQFDMLHEETLHLADQLGQKMSLTKEDIRAQARAQFIDEPARKQDLVRYLRESGRLGNEAYDAWIKQDLERAFELKQQQVRLFAKAELAKKFEKRVLKKFDQAAKRYNAAEVPSMPQSHLNWIQDILHRVGRPPKRSVEAIQEAVSHQEHQTLEEFTKFHNQRGLPVGYESYEEDYNPNIPIAQFLYDRTWASNADTATVGEMTAINNSLQALIKHGRGQNIIKIGDREIDFRDALGRATTELAKLGDKPTKYNWKFLDEAKDALRQMNAGLLQMESLFGRWDLDDPRGFFTQHVFMPIIRATNRHDALRRTFSKRIIDLKKWDTNLEESIRNDVFADPDYVVMGPEGKYINPPGQEKWLEFNRGNLRAVLLNVGNESNLDILARGFLTTKDKVWAWAHQHATEADWKWAQAVGKIFEDIQKESDRMTMGMSGSVIEKIPLAKIPTRFGTFDGWYYPAIYDRTRGGGPMGTWEQAPLVRVMTDRGFERKRTGYAGPMDLHIYNIGDRVDRRLRDIALRPTIIETSKLLLNREFQTAVNRHYGNIYSKMFEPWLKDIAGQHNPTAGATATAARIGEYLRVNTIGALIGWNPGTVGKHSMTSFVQSVREVGPVAFAKAVKDLWQTDDVTMKTNRKFIMEGAKVGNLDWTGSTEVQRRMQHWEETIGGAQESMEGGRGIRAKSLHYGSLPVASIDQWISQVTWLGQYRKTFAENLRKGMTTEEGHMDAVDMGDRAVRRSHGSTSIAARPEFMRVQGPLAKTLTSLYGFFNHIFNRYYRMGWMAKEIAKKPSFGDMASLVNDAVWYVGAPILVEQLFEKTCDPKEGWGTCIGKSLVAGLSAPVPILREIAHAMVTGHDPAFGIMPQAYKAITDMVRDAKHMDKQHFGNAIEHFNTLAGVATGLSSKQLGRWQKFAYNYAMGYEHPRTFADWGRAFRWGTAKEKH